MSSVVEQHGLLRESNKDYGSGRNATSHAPRGNQTFVYFLTAMAAVGGFLFGYDTGVVSGALLLIKRDLDLDDWQQEVAVSITMVAAVIGSLSGGPGNDTLGRRLMIFISSLIFAVGGLVLAAAPNYMVLVIGRFIVGLGIGLASLTVPVYIAEVAPPHLRGRLTMLNTLAVTGGQFIAGMADGLLSGVPGDWRWMLGLSALPALIQVVGCTWLPESPRWLVRAGREEQAREVLRSTRGHDDVSEELEEIVASLPASHLPRLGLLDLFRDPILRRALTLGCGLMVLNQLTGINTVMYYSATIYSMAGFSDTTAIWLAGFTALAQALGVAVGLVLVERCGRRFLILVSLGAVSVALFVMGLSFHLTLVTSEPAVPSPFPDSGGCAAVRNVLWGTRPVHNCYACVGLSGCGFCSLPQGDPTGGLCLAGDLAGDAIGVCPRESGNWQFHRCPGGYGWLAAVGMVFYLAFFGIGMSGIPWTVNAEIYPLRARALCNSVSTGVNWAGNVAVSSTFLTLASPQVLTKQGAFWMYAVIAVAGWCWLYKFMPETQGLTLEEIEGLFANGGAGGSKGGGWAEKEGSSTTVVP